MDNKKASAFPLNDGTNWQYHSDRKGLTKRELIAAMALQGLLANPENQGPDVLIACAFDAVSATDALLKELDKQPEP